MDEWREAAAVGLTGISRGGGMPGMASSPDTRFATGMSRFVCQNIR
jgi:hypothetical protein